MKSVIFLFHLILLSSCTKTTYVIKQGLQQFSLESNGRLNEDVLADEDVSKEIKSKIKKIEKYKKYFYEYFNEETTSIYSKTTFLDSKAVTYLVIASPVNKIEALEHEFPIVGKFPYLGFFNPKDAKEFAKDLRKQNYETYIRDVYAYSTLNQWIFKDNILSSFFHFKEEELATLIFHELFHTVFFVPDEVELNENLAQFVSRKMANEYFKTSSSELANKEKSRKKKAKLFRSISYHANELNKRYQKVSENYVELRNNYLVHEFETDIKRLCQDEQIKDCWPTKIKWNNARLVSFLTYEAKQDKINNFFEENSFDVKSFYKYLQKKYKKFQKKSIEDTFQAYLFKE